MRLLLRIFIFISIILNVINADVSIDEVRDYGVFKQYDKFGVLDQVIECGNSVNQPVPCYKAISMLKKYKTQLKPYSYWQRLMNESYRNAAAYYRGYSGGDLAGTSKILMRAYDENEGLDPVNYLDKPYKSSNKK